MPEACRFASVTFGDGMCYVRNVDGVPRPCRLLGWALRSLQCLNLSGLNCPSASENGLLLEENSQELVDFKFSGFLLSINRGICYILKTLS